MTTISNVHLTYGHIGNHNAQGGEGNHTDIKELDGRPYLSGQTIRQAIRDALHDSDRSEEMNCTPSRPCGQIDQCMLCDLFGYFAEGNDDFPDDTPTARRGPLSVPFAIAETATEIVPDQLAQFDEISGEKDHNLATRDVAAAVYRGGWSLNADRVGHRRTEEIDEDASYSESYSRKDEQAVKPEVQAGRVRALVNATTRLTSFAGQARHAADWMPDLVVMGVQETGRNRLMSALKTRQNGNPAELATRHLEAILSDVSGQLVAAGNYDPDVISNWDATMDVLEQHDSVTVADSPTDVYERIADLAAAEITE